MSTAIAPNAFVALVVQLGRLGVTMPPAIADAAAVCADAHSGGLTRQAAAPPAADVLRLDRDGLLDHIRDRAAQRLATDILPEAVHTVAAELAQAAGQAMRAVADDLIGQMRPAFDRAATVVHAAHAAGLRPGHTAEDVLDLPTHAVAAFKALPAAVAAINTIAACRNAMADTLDIAPLTNSFAEPPGTRNYAAAFSVGPVWRGGRNESDSDRWLRIAASGPLRLLSIADTDRADRASRPPPRPPVDPTSDVHDRAFAR